MGEGESRRLRGGALSAAAPPSATWGENSVAVCLPPRVEGGEWWRRVLLTPKVILAHGSPPDAATSVIQFVTNNKTTQVTLHSYTPAHHSHCPSMRRRTAAELASIATCSSSGTTLGRNSKARPENLKNDQIAPKKRPKNPSPDLKIYNLTKNP